MQNFICFLFLFIVSFCLLAINLCLLTTSEFGLPKTGSNVVKKNYLSFLRRLDFEDFNDDFFEGELCTESEDFFVLLTLRKYGKS